MGHLLPDDVEALATDLARRSDEGLQVHFAGLSAEGRALIVLRVGTGTTHLAVKGNAHADEPAGTVTCCQLARWLLDHDEGRALARRVTCHFLPTANPDGLERNRAWLTGDGSLLTWLRHVRRDPPPEDREFGYGPTPEEAAHPENRAWHAYLAQLPRLDGYVSLHSMAFAGGAWFLAMLDSVERRRPLLAALEAVAAESGLPLHDEDRGGRKGFHRIAPGFCTAPTSEEMASYFAAGGVGGAERWLRLNSMQVARRLHGTPVALVSELPQWWDPALADMTATAARRREVDLETGRRLEETVAALERDLAAAGLDQEAPEPRHEREHRLASARALQRLAAQWGERPAARRDQVAGELAVRRAEAANAAVMIRLAEQAGREASGWVDKLAELATVIAAEFALTPLPLAEQVRLQRAMVTVLAGHLLEAA